MHGLHYFCAPCIKLDVEAAEQKEYYRMMNGEVGPNENSPFFKSWNKPERPILQCKLCGFLVILRS